MLVIVSVMTFLQFRTNWVAIVNKSKESYHNFSVNQKQLENDQIFSSEQINFIKKQKKQQNMIPSIDCPSSWDIYQNDNQIVQETKFSDSFSKIENNEQIKNQIADLSIKDFANLTSEQLKIGLVQSETIQIQIQKEDIQTSTQPISEEIANIFEFKALEQPQVDLNIPFHSLEDSKTQSELETNSNLKLFDNFEFLKQGIQQIPQAMIPDCQKEKVPETPISNRATSTSDEYIDQQFNDQNFTVNESRMSKSTVDFMFLEELQSEIHKDLKEEIIKIRIKECREIKKFGKKTLVFVINYLRANSLIEWQSLRSFREFKALSLVLSQQFPDYQFPQLPEKKEQNAVLSSNDIKVRAKKLENYLKFLIENKIESPILTDFLIEVENSNSTSADKSGSGEPISNSLEKKKIVSEQTLEILETKFEKENYYFKIQVKQAEKVKSKIWKKYTQFQVLHQKFSKYPEIIPLPKLEIEQLKGIGEDLNTKLKEAGEQINIYLKGLNQISDISNDLVFKKFIGL